MARPKSPLLLYESPRSWWAMAESFAVSQRPWMMRVQAAMLRSRSSPLQASQSARLAPAAGAVAANNAAVPMSRANMRMILSGASTLPHHRARVVLRVTAAVTGEHAGSVRGHSDRRNRDQLGQWESSDKYFHDTSPYLDHLTSAHRPMGWRPQAQRCQRLCGRPVIGITISARFRTIQIVPAAGAMLLHAGAESASPALTSSRSTAVGAASSLAAGGHPTFKHRTPAPLPRPPLNPPHPSR